jgi:chromosome segregation ATPase
MKLLVIILAIACVGLAGMLALHRTKIQTQLITTQAELNIATNSLSETRTKLTEQEKLAGFLQQNLDQRAGELSATSNSLVQVSSRLDAVQSDLKSVQTDLKTAQADAESKGARISALEAEKNEMNKKLNELASQINTLDDQITETKRKLAASEGDRSYLTKELARLQTDKAELVRQFNDLAVLRAQVALLKEEESVNRRLAWAAQGVYAAAGRKGAEVLVTKSPPPVKHDPSLDVEIEKEGGSRVIPPAPPKDK